MTLVKSKREHVTILDFSNNKLSKTLITKSLRKTIIPNVSQENKNTLTVFDNQIKVGMYNISLLLQEDCQFKPAKHLKEYGKFQIKVNESNKEINLRNDGRFKNQQWIKDNKNANFTITNLVEAIYHCHRLNNLRLFL